ncbi:hypothetical protein MX850_00740 [Erysipelothrix sp. Poltava]|nr:hypothetical protein MX850_00740 [Erysipelothrix sp. Poltava]
MVKSKVSQVLKSANANVESFIRFAVGEGIEKREEDFAAEVAKADSSLIYDIRTQLLCPF